MNSIMMIKHGKMFHLYLKCDYINYITIIYEVFYASVMEKISKKAY